MEPADLAGGRGTDLRLRLLAVQLCRTESEERKVKAQEIVSITSTAIPAADRNFGAGAEWLQFWGTVKIEFRRLVKTTTFIVITAFALLNCVPALIYSNTEGFGNTFLPVTYRLLEVIAGTLYLFLIAMITYFAGVLAWEERDSGTDEVHDALPNPEWPTYLAKLTALMSSIVIILAVVMCAALLVQFFHGYHRYQFGLFIANLFGIDLLGFVFLAILAFFIHVISPNKYVGYFGYITFLLLTTFIWQPLHIATYLVQFGQAQTMTYSDFYGYGPFLKSWSWFMLYWTAFCVFLAALTILLWQRGRETSWRSRIRNARLRYHGAVRFIAVAAAIGFVATGGWIFYNTKVLNTVRSENDNDRLQADYEKTYKKFEKQPGPRVTDVKYAIDLYPESRNMTMRGQQTIVNQTSKPLTEIHFSLANDYQTTIEIPGAKLSQDDQRLHYQIYTLTTPMQPGESRVHAVHHADPGAGLREHADQPRRAAERYFHSQPDRSPDRVSARQRIGRQEQTQALRTQGKRPDAGARAELHRRLPRQLHQQ